MGKTKEKKKKGNKKKGNKEKKISIFTWMGGRMDGLMNGSLNAPRHQLLFCNDRKKNSTICDSYVQQITRHSNIIVAEGFRGSRMHQDIIGSFSTTYLPGAVM